MQDKVHLTLEFNDKALSRAVQRTYALDAQTLRQVQQWQAAQAATPSAQTLDRVLRANRVGLDRADGPAFVETRADGSRCEEWFRDGKRDRADGPAFVRTRADGSRREEWWKDGRFVKQETLASLASIPGVTVQPSPM